jgi:uncharacterized membrane protein YhhN
VFIIIPVFVLLNLWALFKKYLAFSILCLLVITLRLIAEFSISPNLYAAAFQTLLPITLVFLLIYFSKLRGRFHRRILVGLLALAIGSFFLMKDVPEHTYGFLALLFLPLSFTRAFYLDFSSAPELDKGGARVAIVLGLVFSFSAYLWLRPYLGEYRIPGLIYTFLLALMMMMAVFRRLRVNLESFLLILVGCVLFTAAVLAYACWVFMKAPGILHVTGDCLYLISLYLIVLGSIERRLVEHP